MAARTTVSKKNLLLSLSLAGGLTLSAAAQATPVFINEIHYDNTGTDTGEAIEIAGPAGTDLSGWRLVLYNGADGYSYTTTDLGGVITDQTGTGFGTVSFSYGVNGIQNGPADGIALTDGNTVVQFLSYEGAFTAIDGVANGMPSTDIGTSEPGDTSTGFSLQLVGSGSAYENFTWAAPRQNSFGAINTDQSFGSGPTPIPEPATLALMGAGLIALRLRGIRCV